MRTCTRQQMRYIVVYNIELTPTLQENILSYHAVTGCDTVNQLSGQGENQHGRYSRSTEHCSMTLDMAHFQNPQYGVWRSSSVESSHQVLMKQTSTTSITVCFKREPRNKRSFLQLGRVSNNTLTVHTTTPRCGIWQMSHCPISSPQSGVDGMKSPPLGICIHSSLYKTRCQKNSRIYCIANANIVQQPDVHAGPIT